MLTIANQVYIFLYAIAGGALAAFLYDIIRIKRRTFKTGVIIVNLEDILYWFTVAILMFLVVYNSNNGEIRGYFFLGNIIGVMLYLSLLSRLIIASSVAIINFIKRILKFIWKVLCYPFIFLYKIISVPVGFLLKGIFKIMKFLFGRARGIAGKATRISIGKLRKIGSLRKLLGKLRKKS